MPALTALEVDAGDGQGYRPAAWDQPVSAAYATNGTYTLRFRFTCADGSVLLSQARLDVQQPQAVAARYQPEPAANVVTYPTATLFTDTRLYPSGGSLFGARAATGKITVAYAQGNSTGQIRKPLIVIEGYDASGLLNSDGVHRQDNYDYNYFVSKAVLGAIYSPYTPVNPGDKTIFNDQLSEVGQYDLIFVDLDNGTDYIQRNAYLVERIIQWVNDTKQPLNGVMQQNVVMGMSTGGLIARYALRDMEKLYDTPTSQSAYPPAYQNPRWQHDTRLYISHEAPHQGANVPLGFQYMVKSIAGISIAGPLTAADIDPDLRIYVRLLGEPATQQLLIYQTDPRGTALHNAWLNEYNNVLGYPQQCRNVATSGGSECGRPQAFGPYAELVAIRGSGLLKSNYNLLLNAGWLTTGVLTGVAIGGPLGALVGTGLGVVMALGDYEGSVTFLVNALPNQQQRRIFHGELKICKDVVFGLFTTCKLDYEDNNNSEAYMLAYDSAPGGIYNIRQFTGSDIANTITSTIPLPLSQVSIFPTFCFVPTTSALDIGNNNVALTSQDLTASYVNTAPPAAPLNSPFANFITAGRDNLTHIRWNELNSKWAFREMQQVPQSVNCLAFCQASLSIVGDAAICTGGVTYSIGGLPPSTNVFWKLTTLADVTAISSNGPAPTFTTAFTGSGASGPGVITAEIYSECGQIIVTKSVYVGLPDEPQYQQRDPDDMCYSQTAYFNILNYDRNLTYTIQATGAKGIIDPGGFRLKGGSGYVTFTLTVTNGTCGSVSVSGDVTFDCFNTYAVYPNPADNALTVEQTDSTSGTSTQRGVAARGPAASASSAAPGTPYTVRLFDSYGVQQAQQATTTPTLQLATGSLPTGLYLLHIEVNGAVIERRRLQITH